MILYYNYILPSLFLTLHKDYYVSPQVGTMPWLNFQIDKSSRPEVTSPITDLAKLTNPSLSHLYFRAHGFLRVSQRDQRETQDLE